MPTEATRRGVARLREVGPGEAARALARRGRRAAGGRLRELRLGQRPLRVEPGELHEALGGVPLAEALRDQALAALPTVAAFERSLSSFTAERRDDLLARADAIAAHRFDLLGSGPVELGPQIDWSRDFISGRRWPRRHIRRLSSFYYDDSDVKVPWELSRFQHLPLLAAAYRLTGDEAYLEELGGQLESWTAANPVEIGVNWLCTMDVAIRAANWTAALALVAAEAAERGFGETAAESLLLHGRFIHSHLETAPARTNHYLSDVAGLLVAAAPFAAGREGAAWSRFAAGELVAEMGHQVRADGCSHEASLPYHRLVCELFVCGTQAADAIVPGTLPDWYRGRLARMLQFVADYTRPDGLAPQIGDNDDGRFLPLDDYGRQDFRSHRHLFDQAERPLPPAAVSAGYPEGGWYVLRGGDLFAIVRCGDTGVYGRGTHAHNDQLSFELCVGAQPLIVDPGSYNYYTNEELRQELRSTRAHATLSVDGTEQNELPAWPRFPLGDRTRAEALEWLTDGPRTTFAGRHHGFESLAAPATHERRLQLDGEQRTLLVRDELVSDAPHELEWTFPLARCDVSLTDSGVSARFEGTRLTIEAAGVSFSVEAGHYSPSYGVLRSAQVVRGRAQSRPGRHATEFRLQVSAATSD